MSGENFFDFREKVTAKSPKPYAAEKDPSSALTVTQVTAKIEQTLKTGLPATLLIRGEVTNLSLHRQSGHLYFTLKDAGACIDCVMFRSAAEKLKFEPQDGIELLASGSVGVYAQRGKYQLYVTSLQPLGQGALELAFQQLRAKLETEGLFEATRKRRLPKYPTRLVLITSRETAALADMLKILNRYPWIKLFLYHVPVQGAAAAPAIAAALNHLGRSLHTIGGADAILLGRGGGSLEDLWAFNDEAVARAIANAKIPVISGIGHEVDVSIADLVADYHAHTPTEAARVVMTNWEKVLTDLATSRTRLDQAARSILQHGRQRLTTIERQEFFRRPIDRIQRLQQRLDDRERALQNAASQRMRMLRRRLEALSQRLDRNRPSAILARWRAELVRREARLRVAEQRRAKAMADRIARAEARIARKHPTAAISLMRLRLSGIQHRLTRGTRTSLDQRRHALAALENTLRALGPDQVLARGYTITLTESGKVVRQKDDVVPGQILVTRLVEGEIRSTVKGKKPPGLFD